MKISALKVDPSKVEEGEWVDEIPEMEDLRLKVRGIENYDARRLRGSLIDTIPRARRLKGLSPQDNDTLTAKVLSRAVLVDWANMTDDDGALIPFSAEKALDLLSDPSMAAFRDAVVWAASQVGKAVAEGREDKAGN